jgi:hypothetical protein
MEPRKNPSSLARSILSPQAGHSLFTWNKVPALNNVRAPQFGQQFVRPRVMIWTRVTFIVPAKARTAR